MFFCDYIVSRDIEWLVIFFVVLNNVIIEKKVVVWFVVSGCIFNVGEDFLECIECGKIIIFVKGKF